MVLQQFLEGATTTYVCVALDGALLGGHGLVKQMAWCPGCPSTVVRTVNDAAAAAAGRRLVEHLGCAPAADRTRDSSPSFHTSSLPAARLAVTVPLCRAPNEQLR